jgi:hypothetical protein
MRAETHYGSQAAAKANGVSEFRFSFLHTPRMKNGRVGEKRIVSWL